MDNHYSLLEKYQVVMENINEILFELDNQGRFVFVSPSVEKVTQYGAEEIIGRHFNSFIHPEDVNGLQLGFEYDLDGRIEPRAFRVKNKEGKWVYLRAVSQGELRDNRLERIIGVMTDVTQYKLIEEALINREKYFRALIESTSDVLMVLKEDAVIQYATPAVHSLTGYSVEEVVGENIFKYIYSGDAMQSTRMLIQTSSNPGYTARFEIRFNHKDGSVHYAEVNCKNVLDNPSVCGIIWSVHDVTARKNIEERAAALEQELQRLRTLLAKRSEQL